MLRKSLRAFLIKMPISPKLIGIIFSMGVKKMVTVKHKFGWFSKLETKTFETWQRAIEYCLRLRVKPEDRVKIYYEIRENDQKWVLYDSGVPTGDPVGFSFSDEDTREAFLEDVIRRG